ncbi:hypothetical protein ACQPW3_22435 [Actinosynnema sp. CA-248983]
MDRSAAEVANVSRFTHFEPVYDLTVEGVHTYHVAAGDQDVLVHNCGDGTTARLESLVDEIVADASIPRRQRPGTVSETVGELPSGLLVAVHSRSGSPGAFPEAVQEALTACNHAHGGCSEVSGVARLMELGATPVSVTTMGIHSRESDWRAISKSWIRVRVVRDFCRWSEWADDEREPICSR